MEKICIDKFPDNTSILLRKTFLQDINNKIEKKDKRHIYGNFKIFRNLNEMIKICREHGITTSELQSNVICYRTARGRVTIKNPVLPIFVNPIFDMLIVHIIADGHCTRIAGRVPSFVYTQCKKEIMDLYLKKLETTFGKLNYSTKYFYRSNRIYVPSIISNILYTHYNLSPENFMENDSTIPEKMIKKNKEHLIAVLIAFILDGGNIDSSNIVIGLHNERLLLDIKKICDRLEYRNILKKTKRTNNLYILSEGVKKFWKDYKHLKKKYPELDLDYKGNLIEDFIIRKRKIWKTAKQGETQNKIINLLKKSKKTVKELSVFLQTSRQGTKYHLKRLELLGIVKRSGKGYAGSDIYKLIKYTTLPVKMKSRSRQYGITNNKIINLLKRNALTTKEISNKIKVDRATTLHFMIKLEKDGKVIRSGKKIHRTRPSILWSVA